MYCFSKQIHPPTVVEQSIYCNFYNDRERNLIVGGGNQIKVYRLISCSNQQESTQNLSSTSKNESTTNKVKLECQQTFSFFGVITSINHVRLNKSVRDSILITFMDSKLSIVEYDPNNHNLRTLSMNYFEDDEFKQGYINNSIHPPIVRADPDSRCCAMFNYGRNIIIIPFKSETATDEHVDQIQSLQEIKQTAKIGSYNFTYPALKNTILPAYKLDLQDKNFSGEKINNIIDLQFLEGYYEPTLLILYEPIRTWSGRIAVRQDTCAMIALSLNVHQKVHPIIWSTNNLPFDSQYVLPVPRPIGGVLIFCTNILIYLNQSVPPFAVSLNSFAESSSAFPLQIQRNIKISLDCSRACFLSNDKLVICLKEGEIYVVTLFIDRMRCVKRFHFEKAASTVIASCLTFCGKEYLFLGSRLGNSLLLKYTEQIVNVQSRFFDEKISISNDKPKNEPLQNATSIVRLTNGLNDDEEEYNNNENEEMETDNNNINQRSNENDQQEDDLYNQRSNDPVLFVSFVNDDLDKNGFYGENEFIFKEQPVENYKKRKIDEIEFDDEDKELYGDDDPIFHNEDEMNNQLRKDEQELNNEEINDKQVNNQEINEVPNQECDDNNEEENLRNLLNDNDQDDNLELYNEVRFNGAENTSDPNKENDENNQSENEDQTTTAISDWMAGNVNLLKDAEELEIFGPEENDIDKLPITLVFEVCDSIINIGPCSRFCMGEYSFISKQLDKDNEPQIELVTTSGHGKNGALCVLQRTIRPQIVESFTLHECLDMWTVYSLQKDIDFADNATNDPTHHAYLILSRNDSTMILQTGQEINELDQNGFICNSKTIFASNLCNNKYIIQVTPYAIRLIEGTRQIKNFSNNSGFPIVSATLADPHCIVMTENGTLIHLDLTFELTKESGLVELGFPEQKAQITSCSLYKDLSGLFVTKIKDLNEQINEKKQVNESTKMVFENDQEIDDLDELLYGDSDVNAIVGATIKKNSNKSTEDGRDSLIDEKQRTSIKQIEEQSPTYWLFLTRKDGSLEIYSIPDVILVYLVEDFASSPSILSDLNSSSSSPSLSSSFSPIHEVNEIFVGGFGMKQSKPLIFVRFKDEICVYETFQYTEAKTDNHLKLRFSKLNNTLLLNETDTTIESEVLKYKKYFRPFIDISGYDGVFVCGSIPHWFFMTDRGELRMHEMSIDGYIPSFSSFNNINCPKGFLYFNDKDEMRISVLPTHITYDSSWPVRKVQTKCTVHFIKYHVDEKCYVVVTSVPEEYRRIVKVGDERDYEYLDRDERYIWPTTERFSIQLFSPISWQMISGTKIDLDEWEHVTCLQNVMLLAEGTETGYKGFVALGTNYCYGEDVTNKGRIMILDIVDVVPEPGQPLTKNKIKVVYSKEQKGPVTALCQVKGYLLSSIGQKIYIWQLKEDQLAGVAFIDTQIYIHSAVSIKNLVLVADYFKSVSLLRYQEETKTLALVSKDVRSFEVYGCEFMVDNNLLCFIVSDSDMNIILYNYQPEVRESNGGTRLIQRADFHIGSKINHFFRIKCKKSKHCTEEQNRENASKQLTMFATLDGSLGYILPVSEKIYRRLLMVQNLMNNHSPNLAGLNPKAFRLFKSSSRILLNPCKNVLDGDLLSKFTNLSIKQKNELARKIGTTTQQIRKDLFEIDRITGHF